MCGRPVGFLENVWRLAHTQVLHDTVACTEQVYALCQRCLLNSRSYTTFECQEIRHRVRRRLRPQTFWTLYHFGI